MPTTYASEELKAAFQSTSGMTPDRRNLLYHITCPMSQEPCIKYECRHGRCLESTNSEQEAEIFIAVYPRPGVPHPPYPLETYQNYLFALSEAMIMLDRATVQNVLERSLQQDFTPEQTEAIAVFADGVKSVLDITDQIQTQACQTCERDHLSTHDNCLRCERILRHPAS